MAGHPATRGQDSLGDLHSIDVFGRGLDAYQHHVPALAGGRDGLVGRKDDFAEDRARRGRQAAREHFLVRRGIEPRMEQLIKLLGFDAHQRGTPVDQPLAGHVHRDSHGGLGGALAGAGLKHEQAASLDGELEVLHVAEMFFEAPGDIEQVAIGAREVLLERGVTRAALALIDLVARRPRASGAQADLAGRADASDHILALRIGQELAINALLAGCGIAGEGDAGCAIRTQVAEDHRLNSDCGTPVARDIVDPAVGDGAFVVP
jgi:hypothetical protein